MSARNKPEWKEIKIPGMRDALVCVFNGKEIGTIARASTKAAWSVYAGIGMSAKHVGNFYSKEGAKYQLLSAPESFWK